MERKLTIDRITSDICTLIECNLSPYCDCYFLAAPISAAVQKCLQDSSLKGEVAAASQAGLAKIILFAVESVLTSYRLGEKWVARLSDEVEHAVFEALCAVPASSY